MRVKRRYEAVPINSNLIGGHFGVQDEYGRVIGVQLRFDKSTADMIAWELEAAFERGAKETEGA